MTARLLWATDVHLDFLSPEERAAFYEGLRSQRPDRVVLTGDIADARRVCGILTELQRAVGVPVDVVMGNHDYYGTEVAPMREVLAALPTRSPGLRWIHGLAATELSPRAALVGVDGWGDARLGNHSASPVLLNDFIRIGDLAGRFGAQLVERLRALGDDSAKTLRQPLHDALAAYEEVFVATHVPPFRAACWHEGEVSNDDWLPYFTCHAVGEVLLDAATAHPHRSITVLCGHTHSEGVCAPRDNLRVLTGGARYGHPSAQQVFSLPA